MSKDPLRMCSCVIGWEDTTLGCDWLGCTAVWIGYVERVGCEPGTRVENPGGGWVMSAIIGGILWIFGKFLFGKWLLDEILFVAITPAEANIAFDVGADNDGGLRAELEIKHWGLTKGGDAVVMTTWGIAFVVAGCAMCISKCTIWFCYRKGKCILHRWRCYPSIRKRNFNCK